MTALALNLLLTGLWVLVTGDATVLNGIVGYLVGLALLAWLWPVDQDRRYFRKLPAVVGFLLFFIKELIQSSIRVSFDVVTPLPRRHPAIVCVPLDVRSDAEIALLANLTTLTPGTIVIGISPDRKWMLVHAMFAVDDETLRREIKQGYERRVRELLS